MKVSLSWLQQFGGQGLDVAVDELVERIGAQLGAVEEVENLGEKYAGIVIAKVVKCVDHPDADRLHVCTIDDGGITKGVNRDADGYVQVVCGAPNVREGLTVAWLPPGATVPDSVGKEPFVLEARELRGVVSNGMLASPKELGLSDEHDGILVITEDDLPPRHPEQREGSQANTDSSALPQNDETLKPGADFAKVFGLDTYIVDIENKMFTHRPDLFGQLGVAREIAGISGQQFTSPTWYVESVIPTEVEESRANQTGSLDSARDDNSLVLEVINEAPEVVPRLMTLAMKNVKVKPSPLWLQCALISVGAKPINNVVDVTNYIMFLTAQPTHAYDYDKIRGQKLVARLAKPNEKVTLLNHKSYELDTADIVIADGDGPIGLGGVMGGGDSEVSNDTTNIVLECANFDMYTVRRSSMRHGVFTDALTRFNKGQSPLQNDRVIHLLMQSIQDVAGGEVAGPVADEGQVAGREWVHPPVPVTAEFINARLGIELSASEMKKLLENVEFTVGLSQSRHPEQREGSQANTDSSATPQNDTGDNVLLTVTAPFWRTDIETREDVVEEVGRLHGFDKLPQVLPSRSIKPADEDEKMKLKNQLREALAKAGANELLTYSFVHGELLDKVGQDKSLAYSLSNALSPDLQYYRLSLTPSLLEKVHSNSKSGYDEFAIFEVGTVHAQSEIDDEGLPKGIGRVGLVYAATKKSDGAAYYRAKLFATRLLSQHGDVTGLRFVPVAESHEFDDFKLFQQLLAPFDKNRAAVVFNGERPLGIVGEYKPSVVRTLKLPKQCAGFELFMSAFSADEAVSYTPLSRFPSVQQDITLKVPASVAYQELAELVSASLPVEDSLALQLEPLGIYQAPDAGETKNVSFRLHATSYKRTLTDAEVNSLLETVAQAAHDTLGAERI